MPNIPQTFSKICHATFADRLLVWPPENGLHLFFCKHWAPFLEVKQRWAPFFPRFSRILSRYLGILFGFSGILPKFLGILPGFSPNQNFWRCAWTPCTPASYTTAVDVYWLDQVVGRKLWSVLALLLCLKRCALRSFVSCAPLFCVYYLFRLVLSCSGSSFYWRMYAELLNKPGKNLTNQLKLRFCVLLLQRQLHNASSNLSRRENSLEIPGLAINQSAPACQKNWCSER